MDVLPPSSWDVLPPSGKNLYESEGFLYTNGKLVILFALRNAMMKILRKTHPKHLGLQLLRVHLVVTHNYIDHSPL